jgi:peptidylprolyl isomerase
MRKLSFLFAAAAIFAPISLTHAAGDTATSYPAPSEIVAAAPAGDWTTIDASDLLVMDLAPDNKGKPRRVVIQLMPAPFSQGWIGNIRKLAAAHFWDGTSVNRVQDNYVVQWGDASEKKALPPGLVTVGEEGYLTKSGDLERLVKAAIEHDTIGTARPDHLAIVHDPYSDFATSWRGWSVGSNMSYVWPVHCYGMVGVGRNLSPDTGTGAELYTVIGHAPRHLDRNIALVGRVIEGMENLSSLPRGTGDLGFYKTAEERTPILSVRMMNEMPNDKPLPAYEYLNTESKTFAKYADARANRRDPFFIKPAGGADICNIPVPVRRKR